MPLAVLGDGQGTSGSMERSQATTFFGPHVGRLRFAGLYPPQPSPVEGEGAAKPQTRSVVGMARLE